MCQQCVWSQSITCLDTAINQVMRIEGSGAFPPRDLADPYALPPSAIVGPYNRSNPLRWECNGANCSNAPGAIDASFAYTGSVVEYASPLPVLGVWQLFLVLCPIGRVIVFLYAGAGCLQLYNLYMMWLVMRASDDLNNADSWNQEMLVLKGLVLTTLVIFTPACLYGGYITAYGDTLRWGAYHRLSIGWALSILLSIVALIPFYGAWKSFKSRPVCVCTCVCVCACVRLCTRGRVVCAVLGAVAWMACIQGAAFRRASLTASLRVVLAALVAGAARRCPN